MSIYKLMHKDDFCATLLLNEVGGLDAVKIIEPALMPYLSKADTTKMKIWWKNRAVPSSRKSMMDVIRRAGFETSEAYLAKNLALSINDCYWICPIDMDLKWDEVKLWNLSQKDMVLTYHNDSSYDANASLGGQLEKYWDFSSDVPKLVKESESYYGQQSINEAFATFINDLQNTEIPYVPYKAVKNGLKLEAHCYSFTTENVELIPAYEVLSSEKKANDISGYQSYIEICEKNGLSREKIVSFMDYQTSLDFVISNVDRHLSNFGVLRDADTLKLIDVAPIFDNGNSMFYDENIIYNRATILERPITSFYTAEERMLKNIQNKDTFHMDCLPKPITVKDFYRQSGIPEEKCDIILKNYQTKIELFRDFQRGKSISMYVEKKETDQNLRSKKKRRSYNDFER
ncbi:MAG: hypothetical protein K6G65_00165 [Lachnospiraceae bacterium]|nr:hypothetical protein [Lachnospiraceae bacterium]